MTTPGKRVATKYVIACATGVLALVAVAGHFLRRTEAVGRAPSGSSESAMSAYPIPSFGRAEEAERYFEAMIQGDTRAIELLDQALVKARAQPTADADYVKRLEQQRAERSTRLAAHRAARR